MKTLKEIGVVPEKKSGNYDTADYYGSYDELKNLGFNQAIDLISERKVDPDINEKELANRIFLTPLLDLSRNTPRTWHLSRQQAKSICDALIQSKDTWCSITCVKDDK